MGGEDLGLRGARRGRHRRARRREVGARGVAGALQPRALLRGRPRGRVLDRHVGRAQVPRGPDGDAGRRGHAAAARAAGRRRRRVRRPAPPRRASGAGAARGAVLARRRRSCRPRARAARRAPAAACGPRARTRISSPCRTPRTARPVRLRPSAGPVERVAFVTSTRASSSASAPTNRAAGRACRPSRGSTRSRSSSAAPAAAPAGAASGLARVLLAELRRLHPQRAARLARDLVERRAAARPRGRRDRALDERRRAQQHRPAVGVGHLRRHLRAHQRAAEVHQDEHAVGRADRLDRRQHPLGVRPDRAVVHAARRGDRRRPRRPSRARARRRRRRAPRCGRR